MINNCIVKKNTQHVTREVQHVIMHKTICEIYKNYAIFDTEIIKIFTISGELITINCTKLSQLLGLF